MFIHDFSKKHAKHAVINPLTPNRTTSRSFKEPLKALNVLGFRAD
jgi:hypothetical protein